MKLNARDRRAMKLGLIALIAIFVAQWIIIPWVQDWSAARARIADLDAMLTDRQRQVSRVLVQRSNLADSYGSAINEPLLESQQAQIGLFQVALDVLGANGFALSDYQPQRSRRLKDVPGVEYVPLQVRGTCKLKQLATCLAALRHAKTLVFVDRITMTNNEKKPGKLEVTLVLATLAETKEGDS